MKAFGIQFMALIFLSSFEIFSGGIEKETSRQWPQWRGPLGTGVSPHGDPPITWSENRNLRWKISIPGRGNSTPIIWNDRIFLTTAIPYGEDLPPSGSQAPGSHDNYLSLKKQKFSVFSIDRKDGRILWNKVVVDEQPNEGTHRTGSWASNSPVTDGDCIIASFGSRGIYCLDMDGKLVWQKDFGEMTTLHGHGEGSSPVLHDGIVIVNWDHQGQSFVVALNKFTGKQIWKVPRDEITSWSTPIIVEHAGSSQVVVSATERVRGYNLLTGKVIWQCGGLSRNVVASPVSGDGYVYVASSYDRQAMFAIRLATASGDITNTNTVAWSRKRHTPYVPSPLLYQNMLFFLKHNSGIITCLEAKSGKLIFGPDRLPEIWNVFASPMGAADRIYITSREGTTVVIKRGTSLDILSQNSLDDSFSASPVAVDSELYLRGQKFLYCLAEENVE